MNPLSERYEKIASWCDQLEEASYDCYKVFPAVAEENLLQWEQSHGFRLPEGLRNWYLLSNGYDMSSTADILPMSSITEFSYIDELKPCFIVGHYIGDGSMLVIDDKGNFYEFDHGYHKLHPMQFETFLDRWILDRLEDCMYEAGLR